MLFHTLFVIAFVSCSPIVTSILGNRAAIPTQTAAVPFPQQAIAPIDTLTPTEQIHRSPSYICLQLEVPVPNLKECVVFFAGLDESWLSQQDILRGGNVVAPAPTPSASPSASMYNRADALRWALI